MKVTAWTNEEYARKHYIDPFDERLKLLNPNKKMITPKELVEMAKSKDISNEEMYQIWSDVNYLQSKDCRLSVGFRKLHFLIHRMLQYLMLVKQADKYLPHPPQT